MANLFDKFNNKSENTRIVLKNALGAFAVKGLSLILSLFTMPIYLQFFNDQVVLGLWFTIVSVLNWMLTFDLGIGNGLRNHLTTELANKNMIKCKSLISSAYFSIGLFCIILGILFWSISSYIDWNYIFAISGNSISNKTLKFAVDIVFIGILLQFFLKIITSILYAIQRSAVNNFIYFITSLITVVAISLVPKGTNEHNLILMAIVNSVCIALPMVIISIWVFSLDVMKKIKPSLKYVNMDSIKKVLSLGFSFFYIQVIYMIIMNTNPYLITILSGSKYTVDNQIYTSIFMLVATLFSLAMTPVWSVVTKAYAENNLGWLRKLYSKLLLGGLVAFFLEILLIPFTQFIVNIWLGINVLEVKWLYSLCFVGMTTVVIFNSIFSSFANGIGCLKLQLIYFSIGAIVKIPLAILFVDLFNSWIGVVVANIVAMLPYLIIQPLYINKYLLKK